MLRLATITVVLALYGVYAGDERCLNLNGRCQKDSNSCLGGYRSRLCNGASDRRCCLPSPGDTGCSGLNGFCQEDSQTCTGEYRSGLCAGGSNRRCCLSTTSPLPSAPDRLSNKEALKILQANGMTTSSSGNCMDKSVGSCTSFTDMRKSTLMGLVAFKNKLPRGCHVNVSGGSEEHSKGTFSHGNGYKVDISLQTCIDAYITGNFKQIKPRTNKVKRYQDAAGDIYAREGDHWDILYF